VTGVSGRTRKGTAPAARPGTTWGSSFVIAGILCALCLGGATRLSAAELREAPGLLEAMTLWLEANFGLPAAARMPALVSVPAEELSVRRYGHAVIFPADGVVALYDEAVGTIFVSDEWTGQTVADHSVLLHELVHHMQAAAGQRFACPADREVLAYAAQEAWLNLFGESLQSAFGIDRLTILVTTTCTN